MRVFISHSSTDDNLAARLEQYLEEEGFKAWLDSHDIRAGALLGHALRRAIDDSHVVVLLWSAAAADSRWVNLEWLVAFHQNRFIIPCVLDETELPFFLQMSAYLDLGGQDYDVDGAAAIQRSLDATTADARRRWPMEAHIAALNGLGNILFFRHDLCAAEFFHERAFDWAEALGLDYPAAKHDLEMVRRQIGNDERRLGRESLQFVMRNTG